MSKAQNNFVGTVLQLAELAHHHMMKKSMMGDCQNIAVCGVTVTCADDLQSVKNRLCQALRRVSFWDIDSELARFEAMA